MRYFGGKARIASRLAPVIQSRLKPGQAFVDLFCGSCNIVSRIQAPIRIANDVHKSLILLHKAVQDGWVPPAFVSESEYAQAKSMDDGPIKGFVGFGWSFGGKWFGGYTLDERKEKYAVSTRNTLLKKHKSMKDVQFLNMDYSEVPLPPHSLVYCDIPYRGTTGYSTGDFDHTRFYAWAAEARAQGHDVLVSEYANNVQPDWEVVWSISAKQDIRRANNAQATTEEILMRPCPR